jgi:PIN domain nuclease of toxin-antitoxin system
LSTLQGQNTLREVSAVSLSEIAIKQARGKLTFEREDVLQGLADLHVRVLPYNADHAYALFDLPLHHTDPFDRQIIAQAIAEEIPVITSDHVFRQYKNLKLIW